MRYVSIDIETLGIDPDWCDMIEFGAVIDDFETPIEKLPRFQCYVTRDDEKYRGEPYAMAMHPVILRRMAIREQGFSYVPYDLLAETFADWLHDNGFKSDEKVVVAGKNFHGFDMRFLRRLEFPRWVKFCHRALDPGSMYFDPKIDIVPPDTEECLKRAGFVVTEVAHTAVEDAVDVIRLIRHKYRPVPVVTPSSECTFRPFIPKDHYFRVYEQLQDEGPMMVEVCETHTAACQYVEEREKGPLGTCSMFFVLGPGDKRWNRTNGEWVEV